MAPFTSLAVLLSVASLTNAFFLMGTNNILTTQRLDPIVSPGKVAGHVHSVVGGSNFGMSPNTALLRKSECTSVPIVEDKSAYWVPTLYFEGADGSFTSLTGGMVIEVLSDYLFPDQPGTTVEFPDDFRMFSGDPRLRTYDPNSAAQKAVTFLCLDFQGKSQTFNELPPIPCPNGIRSQINFPSCWDGKNTDSPDHKSHVAYRSGGPDQGDCKDPKFPVNLPRIFIEIYWSSDQFDKMRNKAKNPGQPFVFSNGDPTGYGYHADFINGWDKGVLQRVLNECSCTTKGFGDIQCCLDKGIFHKKEEKCRITNTVDEVVLGTVPKLPGNNPVQGAGKYADVFVDPTTPPLLAPVFVYHGDNPTQLGTVVKPGSGSAPPPPPPGPSTTTVTTTITSSPAKSSPTTSLAKLPTTIPPTPTPVNFCGAPPPQAHRRRMRAKRSRLDFD